jgi:hypothetical protein
MEFEYIPDAWEVMNEETKEVIRNYPELYRVYITSCYRDITRDFEEQDVSSDVFDLMKEMRELYESSVTDIWAVEQYANALETMESEMEEIEQELDSITRALEKKPEKGAY